MDSTGRGWALVAEEGRARRTPKSTVCCKVHTGLGSAGTAGREGGSFTHRPGSNMKARKECCRLAF